MLAVLYLFLLPIALLLNWWHGLTPLTVGLIVAILVLVYVRVLMNLTARRLISARRNGLHPDARVEPADLNLAARLGESPDQMSAAAISYFAMSLLAPRHIRRRVVDEYTPAQRTIQKSVSIEIDLEHAAPTRPVYVAFTLPAKGDLHDNLRVVDGDGAQVPTLSHGEFRRLASRTLRVLLLAACPDPADPEMMRRLLDAENHGLREIIRFGRPNNGNSGADEIEKLIKADFRPDYVSLAAHMVRMLSGNYARVAVVPARQQEQSRFVLGYVRTIVPELRLSGLRGLLRMFLGARPIAFEVEVRNALHCQSYHLQVIGARELYVGDFNIDPVVQSVDAAIAHRNGSDDGPTPYWRVRGGRGQNYFHLYTRWLSLDGPAKLLAQVRFFEIPPGSLGRAAVISVANLVALLFVGLLVSRNNVIIDTEGVVFLLTIPGIIAAWLGIDFKSVQMFDGTLMTRVSLITTFALSLAGNVVTLWTASGVLKPTRHGYFWFSEVDTTWTVILTLATVNTAITGYTWWQRSYYYRLLATKPVDSQAVLRGE